MHPGQSAREAKLKNPALYCAHKNCLWKLTDRHGNPSPCQSRKHAHVAYPPIQLNAHVKVPS